MKKSFIIISSLCLFSGAVLKAQNPDTDPRENLEFGIKAGVNATPSFFLNGRKLVTPSSYKEFKQIIDATLATSS